MTMGTPLTGSGPNAPKNIKSATYGPLGGKQKPTFKKVNIPPPARKPGSGTLNLGNGS